MIEKMIKKLTKKRIIRFIIIPLLVLTLMDLGTTYIGVCKMGGFEMSLIAVMIAQQVGFLGVSVYAIVANVVVTGGIICIYIWKNRNDSLGFIFIICIFTFLIMKQVTTVQYNFNSLINMVAGERVIEDTHSVSDIHPDTARKIGEIFDRDRFCRLVP